MTDFLTQSEALYASRDVLGGKGYQLAWLQQQGYSTPPFVVLSANAFKHWLAQTRIDQWIEKKLTHLPQAHEQQRLCFAAIREKIDSHALPAAWTSALTQALTQSDLVLDDAYAVRSSADQEDGASYSFAGQMDSFLHIHGVQKLLHACQQCWISAFSDRAMFYRLQNHLSLFPINTAVIIQKMVAGDVSGVCFTANPTTGQRQTGVINACFGLGEGVVSGACDSDEYLLDYRNDTLSSRIQEKTHYVRILPGGGVETAQLQQSQANRPCLSDTQAKAIFKLAQSVADQRQCPQDIEWTLHSGKIMLLQTRAITKLPGHADADFVQVWDNANIQESYCGVTTPLTFSFASNAYATVYRQTMRLLKVPQATIAAHETMLENLLGLASGRVYYNINNWYRGLLLLPSFSTNKQDMEKMMGLENPVHFIVDTRPSFLEKLTRTPQIIKVLLNLLNAFRRLDQLIHDFQHNFTQVYQSLPRGKFHQLDLVQLLELTKTIQTQLLMRWQAPIINDFQVMMMNGKVHRALQALAVEQPQLLLNHLLSGEEDIASTAPTKLALTISEAIRQSSAARDLLFQLPGDALLAAFKRQHPQLHAMCRTYIDLYGDRCMGELKLESVSLRQDPAFLFTILKNYVKKPDFTSASLRKREHTLRTQAEQEIKAIALGKKGRLFYWRFKKNYQALRTAIKHRENLRMDRTRVFGLIRELYMEIGAQLTQCGALNHQRDIFYLTTQEIDAYILGKSVQCDLQPLVAIRQTEYARYEQEDVPHHFSTQGAAYLSLRKTALPKQPEQHDSQHHFQGTGCYPGVVTAPVKLVFSPQDVTDLAGHILCTVRTDPGWAPLFPTTSGILVERGSALSHSAIVAREMGIPAVVGVANITSRLKDGDMIRLDGATGTVTLLTENDA